MYGKLPNKKDLLQNKLKVTSHLFTHAQTLQADGWTNAKGQERKYFDSGDYAMSKAGKVSDAGLTNIGREHPSPDSIPHLSSSNSHNGPNGLSLQPTLSQGQSGSPVKESSILQRGMSISDQDDGEEAKDDIDKAAGAVSPPSQTGGVPIRR